MGRMVGIRSGRRVIPRCDRCHRWQLVPVAIKGLLEAGRDKATASGRLQDARPLAQPFLQTACSRISKAPDPAAWERAARFPRIHDSEIQACAAIRCSRATDLARVRVLVRTDSRIRDSAVAGLAVEVSVVLETGDLAGALDLVAGVAASVGADLACGLTGAGAASVSAGAPHGCLDQAGAGADIGERPIILTQELDFTTHRGGGIPGTAMDIPRSITT